MQLAHLRLLIAPGAIIPTVGGVANGDLPGLQARESAPGLLTNRW
jgi:hypothetical protein